MYWIYLLLLLSMANACDGSLNDAQGVNEDCNFAGLCYGKCWCCDSTAGDDDYCAGNVPGKWEGDTCSTATFFVTVTWAYLFEGDEVTCANDGLTSAEPDLLDETIAIITDGFVTASASTYNGIILTLPCIICSEEDPCDLFDEDEPESGIMVRFGTDLNTYYDVDCAISNPVYFNLPQSVSKCDENDDNGADSWVVINAAIDKDNAFEQLINDVEYLMGSDGEHGLDWSSTELSKMYYDDFTILTTSAQNSRMPTPSPTPEPVVTFEPTPTPTPGTGVIGNITEAPSRAPNSESCVDYINSVDDLDYLNAGSSCRGNIEASWTGGKTCDSPYIICLPGENTPTTDMMGDAYKSTTYRYSVDDCLTECSYDQRCLGVEFVADANSNLGDCNLLDDIPIAVENPTGYDYDPNADVDVLDASVTDGDALCFEKNEDSCNPYFEAADLNEVMLNCYCPDNRKGFYTKKVKRTVANTRYCDSDSSVEERIKKAQANRMFHLCENWCLFETENPEKESWYWDPWRTCWRETYSGTGEHRSYCDRVIRNPDSIELKFVNYRSKKYLDCGDLTIPTDAPVTSSYVWVLSDVEESCDDACSDGGYTCADEPTAESLSEAALKSAFSEAGFTCDDDYVITDDSSYDGWALPGLKDSTYCVGRQATLSHLENLDTDCSRVLGVEWQRLCACYE